MRPKQKKILVYGTVLLLGLGTPSLVACSSSADVASHNISAASENFEISRRITVINGITDKIHMVVEGKCSMEYPDNKTEIVCKLKDGSMIKNVVQRGDNATIMVEQTTGTKVDTGQYRVYFNPASVVPNVDMAG